MLLVAINYLQKDAKGQPGKCQKGQKINEKCAHYEKKGRLARRKCEIEHQKAAAVQTTTGRFPAVPRPVSLLSLSVGDTEAHWVLVE